MTDVRPDVAPLFEPFTVKSMTSPNRFAMAPMTRSASPDGVPGENVAAYYRRRAAGGVGLIITEGVFIPHDAAGGQSNVPRLAGADSLAGWSAVTAAVHGEGSVIAAQLWHQGVERGVDPEFNPGVESVSPSGLAGDASPRGRALQTGELAPLAGQYAEAARSAKAAGFDAVELHGAHGYLLDQFLWERTNVRADGYGGSAAQRLRFPVEVVRAVRAAVGPDFPILYRFSQWKQADYTATLADSPAELEGLLAPLVDAGVDVFHPSTRRHYVPAFPELGGADGELSLAGWTKRITGLPAIAVGSVGLQTEFKPSEVGDIEPAPVEAVLRQFADNEFDVIAVGRALLSDPEWVNKLRSGRQGEFVGFNIGKALSALY
ncbi:NADH:flavin oxidoreductase [Mycobacteroides abscessus]|uniref:Oxidoreductase n=2 Tax=Mycobacteroides abscessus TaxID=36809 RepID=A0AB33AC38_9MYCO|nr:NADH:flavin oxidoreductase [Mycobacteroides abscessus]AGM29288.1 oxidoreductase [Mycobacteroides abscessus subsp. bolletii 50594]MBL3734025.1 NADH:flavin oxidoreductase [Mycobacteroides abscessus subsp. massiliense]MBL3746805.1 NADH:flavin oxidoreductase [Mycobacteroides abscessus subsp. massiliense]MBL3759126.1 NADH:flavin oxidoreductase [Mycobacteroides abscessus subsp. massiliense]MBN7479802.1 NADH:flavin oxidoreductase [Mycobacteroides abscessus subsp. massiliense]